jgi:serine/threonine-protein kinase
MSKLSLDKFLEYVERSKLVEPERLEPVVSDWKRGATISQLDDAGECAAHLVEAGLLTRWQAHKLLEGRHRGFQLGKYKLLDHLGSGGMSSVYLAEHTLMHRLAAIKVLPQHRVADATYVARFQLEGQSTAALDHPNIVRVYDLDHDGKIHYLVMEYIEGRDLEALVARGGPLDLVVAADFIAQAAAGLDYAHRAGLVHRDIKPANLLVDQQGVVKVLDMGLAKFAGARSAAAALVNDEQVLGTADYVAPEQTVNSNTVDCRADVYSLGCTLYFLLSGHPPFPFGNALQRMAAHQRHTPPSIALDRPETPAALVAICERMMSKSPADRFATAGDVREALSAWLASDEAKSLAQKRRLAVAAFGGSAANLPPLPSERPENAVGDSNVHSPSGALHPGSPFADTDPNLHQATQRIPMLREGAEASPSASQSHVLHSALARMAADCPPPPIDRQPPPPVEVPPAPFPPTTVHGPQATARVVSREAIPVASQAVEQPMIRAGGSRLTASTRQREMGHWITVMIMTGLVVSAALVAILALAR